jgi:alkylation response protein AidB-like acyl-CoA dehydrogenase
VEFDLTEEQRLLGATLRRLLESRYDASARAKLLDSERGWSPELWRRYAELGLLGLPFAEEHGGAAMGAAEVLVVMAEFGRALVLEPFLGTVVLGGGLVAAAGRPEQQAGLLPQVVAGDLLIAAALAEVEARWDVERPATTATPDATTTAGGWRVDGEKVAVLGAADADVFVVPARTPRGVGLFLVRAPDVVITGYPMHDGLRGGDVLLRGAPGTPLGRPEDASGALAGVLDLAVAALCAEAVGAMERMVELTVEHLRNRVQFGEPLAARQALQFRAADMYVSLEQARSMALLARLALAQDDPAERRRSVRAAKIEVDLAARHVGQEAIQLHGGMGMTMEYPVGHYFKRTTAIAKTLAETQELIDDLGADGGLIRPRGGS